MYYIPTNFLQSIYFSYIRYDFTIAAVPLSAFSVDERDLEKCFADADVISRFI